MWACGHVVDLEYVQQQATMPYSVLKGKGGMFSCVGGLRKKGKSTNQQPTTATGSGCYRYRNRYRYRNTGYRDKGTDSIAGDP